MLPQTAAYKTQSPVPTNSKISLGEHMSHLQSELQKAKETERQLSREIQILKDEKDFIKKKISSFCESLEQRKPVSAPNSLPTCWSSIQQLDGLFSYVGKLQELVQQKNKEISFINSKCEKKRKLSSEIQLLKDENDFIKKKISSFCESLEQGNPISAPNSLPTCSSSIQQLDGLFSYVGKLQEILQQKNEEISFINDKCESFCRENALLRGTHQKVDLSQGNPRHYYCSIRDAIVYFFNKYLFDKAEKRKQNSQVRIDYDELIHMITNYFHEWFEDQNQLLQKQQAHIQHLETSLTEKDRKFLGTTTVNSSEILRLQKALHNFTQVTQAHMHVLEAEGKQVEYKLNHMHESFLRYSKKYSSQNINSETPNDNTLEIKLKQLEKRHNKTVALIRNGTEVAQDDFIHAFNKMSHMMENYAQIHSFEKVGKRADIVNTKRNLQLIYQLQDELTLYEEKINKFQGTRESKLYLHFQEMLMRIVEKLDYIESQKKEEIRDERKKAILRAMHLQKKLEERTIQ